MKTPFPIKNPCFLALFILTAACSHAQQQFTITSSKDNLRCNGECVLFDVPDLNGNPIAVIFVTAVEVNGMNLNPHPICAYYVNERWSVINADDTKIPPGCQFSVLYYPKPDNNHFVHIVTKGNLVKGNSYIDHVGLNENPKAQFEFFQNVCVDIRGGQINKSDVNILYDDVRAKWYVARIDGGALDRATGYNISISSNPDANPDPAGVALVQTTPSLLMMKPENSGQRVFMTVVGKVQGQFAGENMANRTEISSFEMEVISAVDAATGLTRGKRQHSPLLIQKLTGPASIQFFNAAVKNEVLSSVTFEVYKQSAGGIGPLDYKIVLGNASIISFKQSFNEGPKGFIDSIKLIYRQIDLDIGGVAGSDGQSDK